MPDVGHIQVGDTGKSPIHPVPKIRLISHPDGRVSLVVSPYMGSTIQVWVDPAAIPDIVREFVATVSVAAVRKCPLLARVAPHVVPSDTPSVEYRYRTLVTYKDGRTAAYGHNKLRHTARKFADSTIKDGHIAVVQRAALIWETIKE